jgi:beta-lactamase regulating signal transducer with metallopeptidase domain
MESILDATSTISATAASALFSAVWEGSVLAATVALCMHLAPRLSAASRSMIWMNAFLLLLMLHIVPMWREPGSAGGTNHGAPILLHSGWSVGIAALWATLTFWRGTELVLSAMRLRRLACRARPIEPGLALKTLLAGERGGRTVELCTSHEVSRPCVLGFFHPRILLPPALIGKLSPQELEQVLLHEMEHLRRADDWTNLFQKIALALFPLNPVLFWAERRLCAERELACDDRVLRSSYARRAYALCLTRLAEDSMLRRSVSLALGAWERRSELVARVHRLLRRPDESMSARQLKLVTGSLMLGVLGSAAALAHCPQVVSFAPFEVPLLQARAMKIPIAREQNLREPNTGASEGSVQFVKAVLRQTPIQPAVKAKAARANATKRKIRPRVIESRQAWMVLTDWNDTLPPPHLLIAVDPVNRNSYAAVPIANGWLIVQI